MITYRQLHTPAEFAQVARLEQRVWQTSDAATIGTHTLRVIAHTGGLVAGAFDGAEMVGCLVGFATAQSHHWSHFTAVLPSHQRQQIGYDLKQFQRKWAIEQGYEAICWTFDPLMSLNANFNFERLGILAQQYHVNFYGAMEDAINAGMPSDRIQAYWSLTEKPPAVDLAAASAAPLLLHNAAGEPVHNTPDGDSPLLRMEIPLDFPAMKTRDFALALRWREASRAAFQQAFQSGYQALRFVRRAEMCYYILQYNKDTK